MVFIFAGIIAAIIGAAVVSEMDTPKQAETHQEVSEK